MILQIVVLLVIVNYLKRLFFIFCTVYAFSSWNSFLVEQQGKDCEHPAIQACELTESVGFWFRDGVYFPAAERLAVMAMKFGFVPRGSLAVMYAEGIFLEQSYEKAFTQFQKMANSGNTIGQFWVGYYYLYGLYVPKNYETAEAWLRLSANKGDAPSQRELARLYMTESIPLTDYAKAFQMASLAAEQYELDAYTVMAQLYEQGKGVPKDLKEAFHWWKRAAEEGLLYGMLMTGNAYRHAIGVERDYSQTIYWYRRASDHQYSDATYYLGRAYIDGMGVDKNIDQGISFITLAAESRNYIAQNYLGRAHLEGIHVRQDSTKAIWWFKRAVANGDLDSKVELALMHLNGQWVDQDVDKAIGLLKEAANQGSHYAAYILGRLYSDNLWVPADLVIALQWLNKAEALGNLNAMNFLVKSYTNNTGVGIDRSKAKILLDKMQNSHNDFVKLRWATLAIEVYRDREISKAAYEFLLDAKSQDMAEAYGILSWVYRSGAGQHFGVQKDLNSSYEIALEGVKRFDMRSFMTIGLFHEFGLNSIPQSATKSQEHYINALNQGSLSAKFRLGISYLTHGNQNIEYALGLINESAKEGLQEAYSYLGWIYENGFYVAQDIDIAKKFYRAAAEDLYEDGQYRLSVLLRNSKDVREQLEGILWLEKAAYGGHSEAQFDLAVHLVDEGIDESRMQAVELAKLSAASGNPRGISMLAWLLGEGVGTVADIRRSRYLFEESANLGDPYSQYMYGRIKFEGDGVPKDIVAGRELLIRACDARNIEACGYLKSLDSINELHFSAEKGDVESQYLLGIEYLYGGSSPKDIDQAKHWLILAAQQGHTEAQRNLGSLFAYELGSTPDYIEALKWFRLSVENGNTVAKVDLGYLYENGYGVEQDYSEAYKWYELGATEGNLIAMHNLGLLYANGRGTERSARRAYEWFLKAAELGNLRAQIDVGLAYERGMGVRQDFIHALNWYQLAADQGSPIAQHNIGLLFANGHGVEVDEFVAIEWFYKAANQNYPHAQAAIGFSFQEGKGVKKDAREAVRWYRLAAKQGNRYAMKNLWAMGVDVPPEMLCRSLDEYAIDSACNVFNPDRDQYKKFNEFLSNSFKKIMESYQAPDSDGLKHYGEVSFCLDPDGGLSRIKLKRPSGSDELDLSILKAVRSTQRVNMPGDECIKKKVSYLKTKLYYDEGDMNPL